MANRLPEDIPIAWWPRELRYAERLSPGTKFADIIGEIDPAKLASGVSMSAEDSLHFGLIPRMHRGIFAMNELPELDELVQVGLFNILGTLTAGYLGGVWSKRWGLTAIYVARGVVILVFLLTPLTTVSVVIFSSLMGFLWLSTVPLTRSGVPPPLAAPPARGRGPLQKKRGAWALLAGRTPATVWPRVRGP